MPSHYQILNLSPTASQEAVREAYKRLAKKHHPDKNPGDPQAAERFKLVNEAYATLSDPQRRAAYDDSLKPKAPPPPQPPSAQRYSQPGYQRPSARDVYRRGYGWRQPTRSYPRDPNLAPSELEETLRKAFGRNQHIKRFQAIAKKYRLLLAALAIAGIGSLAFFSGSGIEVNEALGRARMLMRSKQYEKAKQELLYADRLYHRRVEIPYYLWAISVKEGDMEKAEEYRQRVIEMDERYRQKFDAELPQQKGSARLRE